jgi:hypothetical protein
VNHLERARRSQETISARSKRLAGAEQERWTKPLAAREQTPANPGMDALRRFRFFWDQPIEFGINQRAAARKEFAGVINVAGSADFSGHNFHLEKNNSGVPQGTKGNEIFIDRRQNGSKLRGSETLPMLASYISLLRSEFWLDRRNYKYSAPTEPMRAYRLLVGFVVSA